MIALNVGDKIRGESSSAAVIDYTLHGIVGSTITQIADGQLPLTETDIYTAASIVAISSIILVNTDTSARTINLYLKPASGTSRRLIPKALSLGIGYSMHFDGANITVMDASGRILSAAEVSAHKLTHQDGGADEISITNLSGLLADDQHVLDAEVLAVASPIVSPTFIGTVTMPTPFTLGAVSVTATGTELNYVTGVTSAIQTQLGLKAPLISPSFTTPALGTPSSGTLTSCTGLPAAGVVGTSAVLGANTFTETQVMPAVKITTGAGATKVLTSDTDGDATWEAAGGGMSAASQAEMEAATSNTVGVTPLSTKWHPGVAKVVLVCGVAEDIYLSYNVTSITDGGTGLVTVTINIDFTGGVYAIICTPLVTVISGKKVFVQVVDMYNGSFYLACINNAGTATDPNYYFVSCFGDQ